MDNLTINPNECNEKSIASDSLKSDNSLFPKEHCPNYEKQHTGNKTPAVFDEVEYEKRCKQCMWDIENVSDKALRIDYPDEYKARNNAKFRANNEYNCPFSEVFNDFREFLKEVGPKPCQELSLDKIDNEKGYVPGNVRWADPQTQSENRRNVKRVIVDGKEHNIDVLAQRLGINRAAFLKRVQRGVPMARLVGKALEKPAFPTKLSQSIFEWPWPPAMAEKLERQYKKEKKRSEAYGLSYESRVDFFVRVCNDELSKLRDMANACDPEMPLPLKINEHSIFMTKLRDFALRQREAALEEGRQKNATRLSSDERNAMKLFLGIT